MDARIQAAATAYLRSGEGLRQSVCVARPSPKAYLWTVAIVVFVVSVLLMLQGFRLPGWVVGGLIGSVVALGNRYYYLMLTDGRLLFVRPSMFAAKRTKLEMEVPAAEATAAYANGIIGGKLTVELAGRERVRLTVPRPFRSEGQRMARALAGRHADDVTSESGPTGLR